MSLITQRPTHFHQVIGQERVVRVLKGVIENPQYMTRGFVFSGPEGIGKTTLAYLFAKALMCRSDKPWNCPGCPPCQSFSSELGRSHGTFFSHPDFTEVDAAAGNRPDGTEDSGVDAARAMVELSYQPKDFAKRRVILIDQAHRLSASAWDVYLKPLEIAGDQTIFLFSTSEPRTIPKTILSRSTVLPLALVTREAILGHLVAVADREQMPYTLDGLRRIGELAEGKPRAALNMLQTVASIGEVNPANCSAVLVEDLSLVGEKIFAGLIFAASLPAKQSVAPLVEAFRLADEQAQLSGTARVIDALFRLYAASVFDAAQPALSFPNYTRVNQTFLKWTVPQQLPIDAISLFLMELAEHLPGRIPVLASAEDRSVLGLRARPKSLVEKEGQAGHAQAAEPVDQSLSVDEARRLIGVHG